MVGGGGVGEGGPDGGLLPFGQVEGFDVQGVDEGFEQGGRGFSWLPYLEVRPKRPPARSVAPHLQSH
jgi:hypothetical protein